MTVEKLSWLLNFAADGFLPPPLDLAKCVGTEMPRLPIVPCLFIAYCTNLAFAGDRLARSALVALDRAINPRKNSTLILRGRPKPPPGRQLELGFVLGPFGKDRRARSP